MLTEKAKQQEAILEHYEAKEQEYEELDLEAAHLRNDNMNLTSQADEYVDILPLNTIVDAVGKCTLAQVLAVA